MTERRYLFLGGPEHGEAWPVATGREWFRIRRSTLSPWEWYQRQEFAAHDRATGRRFLQTVFVHDGRTDVERMLWSALLTLWARTGAEVIDSTAVTSGV